MQTVFKDMLKVHLRIWFNSNPTSVAYMRQWLGSALVQIMACRQFGAKPLSKPMLAYCQLDHNNKLQLIFNKNTQFFIHEMHLKISFVKWLPIFQEGMG